MFLYHYFEKEKGPFLSLSDLTDEEAYNIHVSLQEGSNAFARRNADGMYMHWRRMCEAKLRSLYSKRRKHYSRNPALYDTRSKPLL